MTLEPPKGLKSNLMRQYNRFTDQYLAASTKPDSWRKLVFGLCLFHAVIQVWMQVWESAVWAEVWESVARAGRIRGLLNVRGIGQPWCLVCPTTRV